jgi:hypothetical protein
MHLSHSGDSRKNSSVMEWGTVGVGAIMATALGVGIAVACEVSQKHVSIWLGAYLKQRLHHVGVRKRAARLGPLHILFCMVDHFEPISAGSTKEQEREIMRDWLQRYPALAHQHHDSDGRPPQHTWFYPGENYDAEYLDNLVSLCQQGLGEIELHLHHGYDTADTLRSKIRKAISDFAKHGALVTQAIPPQQVYGFIHGNMALDNSMNDPALCGVNDEIMVLKETLCYADFSLPTAPCVSQAKKVNAVYYATGHPAQPKSYDTGVDVEIGRPPTGDLMIVQGPLAFDWHHRKWGLLPRIENAEIQGSNPATPERIRAWVRQHIHVKGRPDWVIVKVSCHGAEDRNREALLGDPAHQMYTYITQEYRDSLGSCVHYVTARELYNIIKAAEAGEQGDPGRFRDYRIPRYQTHAAGIAPL